MRDFVDAVELEPEVIRSEFGRHRDTAHRHCESVRAASDGGRTLEMLKAAQREIAYMEQLSVAFYYLTGEPLGSETGGGHHDRHLSLEMRPKNPVPPIANLPLDEAMQLAKESLSEFFQDLHPYIDQL